ncbi:MAG: GDP-L-fucose synthase [Alphaproteobacteria bacterium]|nr:GDP-L-fucose synthase [Alphaproteobacteria bacterium]
MVGAALLHRLERENYEVLAAMSSELDLRDQANARDWVSRHKSDVVFIAASNVGDIFANDTYPTDFLYYNLIIEANVIESSFRVGVGKLLFMDPSCIYPKLAPQPITEDALLTSPLEVTNEWYAIAKTSGVNMCQAYRHQCGMDFISAMPTNRYGQGDNFDLNSSQVIPALMRKVHDAKVANGPDVVMRGTSAPRREFLHCDDCADTLVHLMKVYSDENHINVRSGKDMTIRELADWLAQIIGFDDAIVQDLSKPDGTPRKLTFVDHLLGLCCLPRIDFERLGSSYRRHLDNAAAAAAVAV